MVNIFDGIDDGVLFSCAYRAFHPLSRSCWAFSIRQERVDDESSRQQQCTTISLVHETPEGVVEIFSFAGSCQHCVFACIHYVAPERRL